MTKHERREQMYEDRRLQWAIINDEYEEKKAEATAKGVAHRVSAEQICRKYKVNRNSFSTFRRRYINNTP